MKVISPQASENPTERSYVQGSFEVRYINNVFTEANKDVGTNKTRVIQKEKPQEIKVKTPINK